MSLEAVYWLALGLGLGLLVLALVVGDIFDFLDFDLAGADVSAAPVFFSATSAFGAGGLLGIKAFGVGAAASVFLGLGTGAGMGMLTALLFLVLRRQESTEGFELSQLVGQRGRCTVPVGPGRKGRVSVRHAGMTRALTATSNEEIAAGEEVVVRDVVGNVLTVARAAGAPGSEHG